MESRHCRRLEDRYFLDSEHAPGGVVVYYADGGEEIIHVNQYVIDLFECDSYDEFIELVGGSFRGFVYGEDAGVADDSIWGQVEKHDNLDHINYRIKTKTGRLAYVEDFGRLVELEDSRPVFHVFVIEAEQRGTVDWLTGLPSMARFHELAEMGSAAIRARGEKPVAVALDLVGMKSFNTQYGRDEGDNLLVVFADVLRKHFGSEACSRFAEDHYYAFAPQTGIDERLDSLFEDFKSANEGRVLPVRVGAYLCSPGDDIKDVGFDRAKIACDLDRMTWQSHIVWFDDEMRARAHLRIHVLDRIDDAIENGWIRPFYQALVRSATGNVCGEEALARWVDPVYGELSPGQFIPVLEEAGLLQKLDMHMVDCALSDMAEKRRRGVPVVPVSVNISLRDLGDLDIVAEISRRADKAGVPRSLLRVEFTESAASKDPQFFRAQVKSLREAGIEVWMDDFGSGYSSLNTLKEYAFDLIKLDMEFVRDVSDAKAREIIAGVIRSAKRLNVLTLAESVETEEQARFLESVGCDVLQGYYFTKPISLEEVMGRFERGIGMAREAAWEKAYWDAVGTVDLADPMSIVDGSAVDGSPLSEFPAGVMECRGGTWSVLRSNGAYRDFLVHGGVISEDSSSLGATRLLRNIDEEYASAAQRSIETGSWERVAGKMEYGTGLQFYTRAIAETPEANAFLLSAVPTMFGTALGGYGDIPVAYAVFRVMLDDAGSKVVDTRYVYANEMYCEWGGFEMASLAGRTFYEVAGYTNRAWFPYCYRAAVLKESVSDTVYSPETGHWLSFNVAPSPIEGCCIFAFTIADDEHREREEIIVARNTSDCIVRIMNAFSAERSYGAAMDAALAMMSKVLHPKRLFVFERGHGIDWVTHEWCADSADAQISSVPSSNSDNFGAWDDLANGEKVIYISDVAQLEDSDAGLYHKLESEGVTHLLAAALYDGDTVIGNLVAENYNFEQGIDQRRLLESVATFISSRIVNQRLVAELERAGTHDSLTGLLNRRGFDGEIGRRLSEVPGRPFVLALMDIDDFKVVNDLHGHDVGDAALIAIADAARRVLPENAVLGRNGGDEFVAMLFDDGIPRADAVFDELVHSDLGCEHEGVWYRLSISVGYAEYPAQARALNEAYSKADAALYSVKLADKAGCKRYSPEIESQYRSQLGFTPRDIAENIPGAILVHRAGGDGEILFANDEAVGMFECDNLADFMEYTGGSFRGIVHPDDAQRVYLELTERVTLDDVGAKNFSNYRIVTKKGNVRHVADNGRLVAIEDVGKVFYVLLVNRDERDVG